ncbi:MAG: PadR family transcriptional regulator, regulatory protein PadR [Anaerophaga sp.]|nr:PadR family transcriptional regulator, regulatory protein PadR [Anaerophaga sp.]
MKIENAKAQMRKGVLEYCILSVLSRGDAYASDIINEMKEARIIVVEGTLYPLLTRLKNAGLLSYRWEESTQGPPRKYYELTDRGREFLQELDKSWTELVDSVQFINSKNQNHEESSDH